MDTRTTSFGAFVVLAVLVSITITTTMAQSQPIWRVGAASRTVLPTVNGRTDYVVPLPPTDANSPGTFVKRFDVGQIAVGNGAAECHWVRDDIRARVATIGPDPNGKIAVFVSVEVYMLFLNDLQQYYDTVRQRVGDNVFNNLLFFVHGQHNHEGPDTSGISAVPVNHDYYDYMVEQMVDATVEALTESKRVNAVIKFGSAVFYYGLGDIRDPRLQDARVRVIRAYPVSGNTTASSPFVTMAQWGMHPEVTLGFNPDVNPANCSALPLRPPTNCAKNAVFTHDYPGWFSQELSQLSGGGEVLYFNGAIGVQIGNHGPVWEVDATHPLGNGGTVPPGAEIVPENYRRAYLIGTQLASFVNTSITDRPTALPYTAFDYRSVPVFVRVTNFVFRVGLVPATAINPFADPTRPFRLGNTLRQGYNCQPFVEPSFETCKPDNFTYLYDSVSGLPFRVGNYMQSNVSYLQIGPLKFLTIPGELCPELATGLPADFDTAEGTSKYFRNPTEHAVGREYTMPGAVMSMLQCDDDNPCWMTGLTNDEIGYMFPISDWRILCTAGENCTYLYQIGALNFTDSIAGSTCKFIVENPRVAQLDYTRQFGAEVWDAVNNTCYYGQMAGRAQGHYEETNAASWDIAQAYLDAVGRLLGKAPSGRYCATSTTCAGIVPSPASGTFDKHGSLITRQ